MLRTRYWHYPVIRLTTWPILTNDTGEKLLVDSYMTSDFHVACRSVVLHFCTFPAIDTSSGFCHELRSPRKKLDVWINEQKSLNTLQLQPFGCDLRPPLRKYGHELTNQRTSGEKDRGELELVVGGGLSQIAFYGRSCVFVLRNLRQFEHHQGKFFSDWHVIAL